MVSRSPSQGQAYQRAVERERRLRIATQNVATTTQKSKSCQNITGNAPKYMYTTK